MEQFNAPSVENVYVGNLLFSFACAQCYFGSILLLLLVAQLELVMLCASFPFWWGLLCDAVECG